MRALIYVPVALALACVPALAQHRPTAFGFSAGSTKSEVLAAVGTSNLVHSSNTTLVLKSSPDADANRTFQEFMLALSPKSGLSAVTGVVQISSATALPQIRDRYNSLRDSVAQQYGPPRHEFDLISSGATATSDDQAMQAFAQKSRHLSSYWLLDDKTLVTVRVVGLSSTRAQIILKFEFRPDYDSTRTDAASNLAPAVERSGK